MPTSPKYIVGTSGYSFDDWVGTWYPPGTQKRDMFARYVRAFGTVELNFTYYRMPVPRTLAAIAHKAPDGFTFWVKANQETTHKRNRAVAAEYLDGLAPLTESGKLAGVLLQFPQSFHRTVETRRYLAATIQDLGSVPLAVEFRHASWDHEATYAGLAERGVTLAVPDVPDIRSLYRSPPRATTRTGYLRLHSRNADYWYAEDKDRYDYDYSDAELQDVADAWTALDGEVDRIYAFFNNCHGGQAARNAEAFRRIVEAM